MTSNYSSSTLSGRQPSVDSVGSPPTPSSAAVGGVGAGSSTLGGGGRTAVVAGSIYCRTVDWLNRIKVVMKDSPLTVLGLSTKHSPKISEIIEQAKILCEDYIFWRLTNSGLLTERDREVSDVERGKLSDVSREIQLIGARLESTYPLLYQNVSRQVNLPFKTDATVRRTLTSVGDFLFKHGAVTWCRVVALLAVTAAVAVECVQNGHQELVGTVVLIFADLVERHVAAWISRQGGWSELMKAFRLNKDTRNLWALTALGTITGLVFTWMTAMQI